MRSLTAASVATFVALSSVAAFGSDPEEDARTLADEAQSGAVSEDVGADLEDSAGLDSDNAQSIDDAGDEAPQSPSLVEAVTPLVSFSDPATINPSSGALAGNKEAWLTGPTTRAFAQLDFGAGGGLALGDNGWAYTWGWNASGALGTGPVNHPCLRHCR